MNLLVYYKFIIALMLNWNKIKLRTIYTNWESFPERENVYDPHLFLEYIQPKSRYFDNDERRPLLDINSNIKKKQLTKYLVNKRLYQMNNIWYIERQLRKISLTTQISNQIQQQENFIDQMLKYEDFKDDEIHEILPFFITNGFGSINEEDMAIEEDIEIKNEDITNNLPSNISNRQSSSELFSTTDNFVHAESNEENIVRTMPEHGTISWWNEFKNTIYQSEGETMNEDAKTLLDFCLKYNKFTLKNLQILLRKLNIRFRRNQRKKSELISLLQIRYSFDVTDN